MDANIWVAVIAASLPGLVTVAAFIWRSSALISNVSAKLDTAAERVIALSAKVGEVQRDLSGLELIRHRLTAVEEKVDEHTSVHVRVKILESQVQRLSISPPPSAVFSKRPPPRGGE